MVLEDRPLLLSIFFALSSRLYGHEKMNANRCDGFIFGVEINPNGAFRWFDDSEESGNYHHKNCVVSVWFFKFVYSITTTV